MLKLLFLAFGSALGAAGATAWLLSQAPPTEAEAGENEAASGSLQLRLRAALAESDRAGQEKEQQLRRQLEALRRNPDSPAIS